MDGPFQLSRQSLKNNVPSNFLKPVCASNFCCATFYQDSSVFGTACMKYVQKHFLEEHLCALQVSLCALVSRLVCVRAHAHSLEGTLLYTEHKSPTDVRLAFEWRFRSLEFTITITPMRNT